MEPKSPAVSPRVAWTTVVILLVIAVSSYMDRQIIALMVEPIRRDFGVSDFQIGLLQGVAFGVFFALFGLPMGWLVDRYPRRLVISGGVTLWSLAASACGLAGNYTQLLLARFGVGIGEATLSPAAFSMIADLFPPRRLALAIGVFATGTTLGSAIAFAVGGGLIEYFDGRGGLTLPFLGTLHAWQAAFLITGTPGFLLAFLIFLCPEPLRRHAVVAKPTSQAPGFLDFLLRHKRYFTSHFFGFGMIAMLAYGAGAWVPVMLIRRFGLTIGEVGLRMGLISAIFGVSGFLWSGWIVDRWFASGQKDAHLRYFAITCFIGGLLSIVAFQLAHSVWLVIGLYAIISFLQPFTGPSAAHLQIVTPNEYRGRVSALFVLVFNLMGMCLGPPSVAFITDFIFHDPARVGSSLALMYSVTAGMAVLLFTLGLVPARRAVAHAEAVAAE